MQAAQAVEATESSDPPERAHRQQSTKPRDNAGFCDEEDEFAWFFQSEESAPGVGGGAPIDLLNLTFSQSPPTASTSSTVVPAAPAAEASDWPIHNSALSASDASLVQILQPRPPSRQEVTLAVLGRGLGHGERVEMQLAVAAGLLQCQLATMSERRAADKAHTADPSKSSTWELETDHIKVHKIVGPPFSATTVLPGTRRR